MLATTIHKSNTTPHHQARRQHEPPPLPTRGEPEAGTHPPQRGKQARGPVVSGPNSVSGGPAPASPQDQKLLLVAHPTRAHYRPRPLTAHTPTTGMPHVVLLRKEVIQPHLPVRLPCYDFVPIADPTFDGSLHKG